MLPVLQIRLLGSFQLRLADQVIDTVNAPRLQSLLAYLLLHPQAPISRQQLASVFWPNTSEAQARTNLRNLLYALRVAFPSIQNYLNTQGPTLEWHPDATLDLDVEAFERCLTIVPEKGVQLDAFAQAVQIYQGDLLPGCYEDWIIPERERLRSAFLNALETLAAVSEDARDYPAALSHTRRLLQADPLQSKANHRLIRLYSLLGDRSAALKAYRSYAQLLQQELGTEPEAEIRELYHRLQQTGGKQALSSPEMSIPLVDRVTEWRLLKNTWQTACAGHARMLFVWGEAGIGKTRLVEELSSWASRQGVETATAFCYPAEGSLPYAPVVSWLKARPIPVLEKTWLTEIARLLPEVLAKNTGIPRVEPSQESWQRLRLFEALVHALLVKGRPQLLILEDIHWCDQDTLEWLHYLLRFDPHAPLLIVATLRSGEITQNRPLITLQNTLRAESRCSEVELHPLNEKDTFQLAYLNTNQATKQPLNAESAAQIYRESQGYPLFVVEMIRMGQLLPGKELVPDVSLAASERVQAVLVHRIGQLSPGAREITLLAAAVGREFSMNILHLASGETEERLVKSLDELLQRRILNEIAPEVYDFTHDRLRQAAFKGLSTAHRRLLHRRIAEAILQIDQGSAIPRDAEIASHYEQAGLFLQAIRHYRLAAEAAAQAFANSEAQRHLLRAVELAEKLEIGGPDGPSYPNFASLLERLADLFMLNGLFPQAQSTFERALAQPFSSSGVWRSQVYRKLSDSLTAQYQYAQTLATLDQAEQVLGLTASSGTLSERQESIQIQLARSQLFYWQNEPAKMDAIIRKIGERITAEGSTIQKIALLDQQYLARIRHERYRLSAETVAIGRQRFKLTETLDEPFERAQTYCQLGFGLLWHGDPAAARAWLSKGTEALTRIGARIWEVRCLAYLSIANRKLGDLESLREQTRRLLEQSAAIDEAIYHGVALANQGWLAWRDGNQTQAEQLCQAAMEIWRKPGGYFLHGLANWVLLAVAVAQHDLHKAEFYAQALLDPNPNYQPVEETIAGLLAQASSACQGQDVQTALGLFEQTLAAAQAASEL